MNGSCRSAFSRRAFEAVLACRAGPVYGFVQAITVLKPRPWKVHKLLIRLAFWHLTNPRLIPSPGGSGATSVPSLGGGVSWVAARACPPADGVIIDLSQRAAEALDFVRDGRTRCGWNAALTLPVPCARNL